jgi:hypothetical protein
MVMKNHFTCLAGFNQHFSPAICCKAFKHRVYGVLLKKILNIPTVCLRVFFLRESPYLQHLPTFRDDLGEKCGLNLTGV